MKKAKGYLAERIASISEEEFRKINGGAISPPCIQCVFLIISISLPFRKIPIPNKNPLSENRCPFDVFTVQGTEENDSEAESLIESVKIPCYRPSSTTLNVPTVSYCSEEKQKRFSCSSPSLIQNLKKI